MTEDFAIEKGFCKSPADCRVAKTCLHGCVPSETTQRRRILDNQVEDHIRAIEWHYATDDEKTLVAGNIRDFAAKHRQLLEQLADESHDECAQREATVTHEWQMLARLVSEYQQYWQVVNEPYRNSIINADFAVREIGRARGRMFSMANAALPKEQLTEIRPTLGTGGDPTEPLPDHDVEPNDYTDETGWVIETSDPGSPFYWTGINRVDWSQDHLDAVRFCREKDASSCAGMVVFHKNSTTPIRVVEHRWSKS